MAKYRLSIEARDDLIQIHQYGVQRFGIDQADAYFYSFFDYFNLITQPPYSFESIDHIMPGYRRCVHGSDSIYFRIHEETVEIMAIVGRQDFL
jgi:toxin ParE1/3/4